MQFAHSKTCAIALFAALSMPAFSQGTTNSGSTAGSTTTTTPVTTAGTGTTMRRDTDRGFEVRRTLGAVKTEFGKFGEILAKVDRKLKEASSTLDDARGKTTTIVRKLKGVEGVAEPEAIRLLATPAPFVLEPDEPVPDEK